MNIFDELKFYRMLSEKMPTKKDVISEIINLQAILSLPKGTEHFISDIHGEYEHF
ncbi:MAG: fructose-bisphosphatase class III, partial [Clostridia bacterium]|nr:fructose-bisphosphatase class III [Clostridia bacterium]